MATQATQSRSSISARYPLPWSMRMHRRLARIRTNQLFGVTAALAVPAIAGLCVASLMPRGPVTTPETLVVMAIGLLTGVFAGFLLRSRWAMLLAPAINLLVFELGRRDIDGPLVDGIHLDTAFGIMGLVLGRGFYVLVGLIPMALGTVYGAALARWRAPS